MSETYRFGGYSETKLTENIVEPVIFRTSSFKYQTKMQMAIRSLGSGSLDKDISSIVGAKIVSSISRENVGSRISKTPVSPNIFDFAYT